MTNATRGALVVWVCVAQAACSGSPTASERGGPAKTVASATVVATATVVTTTTATATVSDANTATASDAKAALAAARTRLADRAQAVRDAAAEEVRALLTRTPAAGDAGQEAWRKKLAAVAPPGTSVAEFVRLTGATTEGGATSGGSTTTIFRLDDDWQVAVYSDERDAIREIGGFTRRARSVWVDPEKDYTGHWVTYFVNGMREHDIDYEHGTYRRFASYYDNGQLVSEQRYVGGQIDGDEIGYHPGGQKAYEIHYAAGKSAGRWVHFYPSGATQSERTYVNGELDGAMIEWRDGGGKSVEIRYERGKETGQAAWDEQGNLLYAHGTAAHATPR